jgi:glyoxylase-like metal-dependent hydrolase (beta-lactamase superfamily II)
MSTLHTEPFYDPRTSTLTYVVFDEATRDAVAIDPVLDYDPATGTTWTESFDRAASYIEHERLRLHFVLETHAHADHLSSSQLFRRRFDAKLAIGERIREVQTTFQPIFDLPPSVALDGSQFDRLLRDGEILRAGTLEIEVIATPGHTPACVTYKIEDAVFTGDALFTEDYGTGRCDFPRGSAAALYDSIQRLYALPDGTRVFVGHDYQPGGRAVRWETTIGASKANNPQLSARTTKAEFVALREARDAQLAAPRLLLPSVQVNLDAGRLPASHANGNRYLVMPLNVLRPADELGRPRAGRSPRPLTRPAT